MHEPRVHVGSIQRGQQTAVVLNAAIFGHPQEDDPVYGHLHGVVELALVQVVAHGQIAGQRIAPGLDLLEEGVVYGLLCPSCCLVSCAYLSSEPSSTASRENTEEILSHTSASTYLS